MRKVLLASMIVASVSGLTLNAQPINDLSTVTAHQEQETPVRPEELPEAVKTVLSGENYAGWSITAASLVNGGENEYYKVELTKGEEKQVVKLNKEGQAV